MDTSAGAAKLTSTILELATEAIGKRLLKEKKSTHPWLTDRAVEAVSVRDAAAGTENELIAVLECSRIMKEEREAYIERTKQELLNLPQGSKLYWTKVRELLGEETNKCNIPALKKEDGTWVTDAVGKANLLSQTLHEKCILSKKEVNRFTVLKRSPNLQWELLVPMAADATKVMSDLKEDSGIEPDELPARILKMCAGQLGKPIAILTTRIIATMVWPASWKVHWVAPLFKKAAVFKAKNYRGLHLTAQVSKVVERLIKPMFEPHLEREISFGPNQFAYRKG